MNLKWFGRKQLWHNFWYCHGITFASLKKTTKPWMNNNCSGTAMKSNYIPFYWTCLWFFFSHFVIVFNHISITVQSNDILKIMLFMVPQDMGSHHPILVDQDMLLPVQMLWDYGPHFYLPLYTPHHHFVYSLDVAEATCEYAANHLQI